MSEQIIQRRRRALLGAVVLIFGSGVAAAAVRGGDDDASVNVSAHRKAARPARAAIAPETSAPETTTSTAATTSTTSATAEAPSEADPEPATPAPKPRTGTAPVTASASAERSGGMPSPSPARAAASVRPGGETTALDTPVRHAFSLSPSSGPAGTRVVAGGGGCAGEGYGVGVTLHDPSGRELAGNGGPTQADGSWSFPFFVPAGSAAGRYEVRAACIAVNRNGGDNLIVFEYFPQPFEVTR